VGACSGFGVVNAASFDENADGTGLLAFLPLILSSSSLSSSMTIVSGGGGGTDRRGGSLRRPPAPAGVRGFVVAGGGGGGGGGFRSGAAGFADALTGPSLKSWSGSAGRPNKWCRRIEANFFPLETSDRYLTTRFAACGLEEDAAEDDEEVADALAPVSSISAARS
jgi:hypothetical protein